MQKWVNQSSEERREENLIRVGYVTRPMNSFMLYRLAYSERCKQGCKAYCHQAVSTVAGQSWPLEPKAIRDMFVLQVDPSMVVRARIRLPVFLRPIHTLCCFFSFSCLDSFIVHALHSPIIHALHLFIVHALYSFSDHASHSLSVHVSDMQLRVSLAFSIKSRW